MFFFMYLWMIADGLTIPLEPYQIYGESPLAVSQDGRFCLGNQDSQLFFFDKNGQLIKKAGGFGQGPGEFQELFQLVWQGGFLFAFDQSYQKWLVFDSNGDYLKVLSIPGSPHARFSVLPLSLNQGLFFSNEEQPTLIQWQGEKQTALANFPFWEDQPSTKIFMDNPVSIYYRWDSDLLLASNGTLAVTMQNISKHATLIHLKTGNSKVVEVPFKRRPVTEDDKKAFLSGFPKNYKAKLKRFETPDYWPGVSRVLIDRGSHVWFFGQAQDSNVPYLCFDNQGKVVKKGSMKHLPAIMAERRYSFIEKDGGWFLAIQ